MSVRKPLSFGVPFLALGAPFLAAAQAFPSRIVPCSGVDCTMCDLAVMAQNIINTGILLAVFLSGVLFAYAGWLYLTTVVEDKVSTARSIFTNVLIGLVIILAAWLVVDVIMKTFLGGSFGPWNSVCSL